MPHSTQGTRHQTKTKKLSKRREMERKILNENKEDGIIRHPRPLGLTYANLTRLKQEKENPQEDKKNKLIDMCIQLYIREGCRWLGKVIPMNQFARYLNIRTETLLLRMNADLQRISSFFEGAKGQQLARGIGIKAVQESLESMALVKAQAELLISQQGGKYVPFLSGEANRALANLIAAQKPLLEVLGRLQDKNPTNIFNNQIAVSATSGTEYLSPEMALKMIQENSPSMALSPELVEAKERELGLLPDVQAMNQDLTKIGVKIPNKVISKDGTTLYEVPNTEDTEPLNAKDFLAKK